MVRSLAQLKEEIGTRYNSTYIPPGELAAFLIDLIVNVEGLVPLDETAPSRAKSGFADKPDTDTKPITADERAEKPVPKDWPRAPLHGR